MLKRLLVLTIVFMSGAGLVALAERPEPAPMRRPFETLPMEIGEWRGVRQAPLENNVLAVLGVDDYVTRAYFRPDRTGVGLYIGYHDSQRQGDTMHSPQNCLPGAGWLPVSHSMLTVRVPSTPGGPEDRDIIVNRYIIEKGLDRQVVLYWYQAHDRVVASEYWAKYYLIRDAVVMNRTDGALVRVLAPYTAASGEDRAQEAVTGFVKALFPLLSEHIPS